MKKYLITNHSVAKPNQVYNTIDFLSVIKKEMRSNCTCIYVAKCLKVQSSPMKGLMNGWPGFRYQLADTCIF